MLGHRAGSLPSLCDLGLGSNLTPASLAISEADSLTELLEGSSQTIALSMQSGPE